MRKLKNLHSLDALIGGSNSNKQQTTNNKFKRFSLKVEIPWTYVLKSLTNLEPSRGSGVKVLSVY